MSFTIIYHIVRYKSVIQEALSDAIDNEDNFDSSDEEDDNVPGYLRSITFMIVIWYTFVKSMKCK